ncbi:hypothetical protein [Haloferax sp. YSSS75]|uniref:hypothetical protein n=1 Tax=Haloferax sp. YSSS75 TaxID=3388564 RepID=UPI00398CE607
MTSEEGASSVLHSGGSGGEDHHPPTHVHKWSGTGDSDARQFTRMMASRYPGVGIVESSSVISIREHRFEVGGTPNQTVRPKATLNAERHLAFLDHSPVRLLDVPTEVCSFDNPVLRVTLAREDVRRSTRDHPLSEDIGENRPPAG